MKKCVAWLLFTGLLLAFGCGQKQTVVKHIPDAENSLFTQEGRLFISSAENIFEIKKTSSGTYTAVNMYEGTANFAGLAQVGNYLYAICAQTNGPVSIDLEQLFVPGGAEAILFNLREKIMELSLLRASLNDAVPLEFEKIHVFHNMLIANGMTADSQGRLYIADSTFLPMGKIVRIDPEADPIVQEDWLTTDDGIFSPNGMAFNGSSICFTDLNLTNLLNVRRYVKKVTINEDGTAGSVVTVYQKSGLSLFDDLIAVSGSGTSGYVVADFFTGQLLVIEDQGDSPGVLIYATPLGKFQGPSSMAVGCGDFSSDELIVTEKGIPFLDVTSDYGNKVVKVDIYP